MTTDTATRGTLTIDEDGRISVRLDTNDWKPSRIKPNLDPESLYAAKFDVIGALPDRSEFVRLQDAYVTDLSFNSSGLLPASVARIALGAMRGLSSRLR